MTVSEELREKELSDIKKQMDTPEGRRVMYRLLKESGCMDRPPLMVEPAAISFYGGKRSVGFDFLGDIMDVVPNKLTAMVKEAKEAQEQLIRRIEKENGEAENE